MQLVLYHLRTLGLSLGFSSDNFRAAASIADAAPSNSFSAMTLGSSGFTQSEPDKEIQTCHFDT